MPFIEFDDDGVCNYCRNHKTANRSFNPDVFLSKLSSLIDNSPNHKCIVPFSGGRDSSYVVHLLKKELNIDLITMTYDWGMVTDLARRNISRITSSLGVENIIVSDNITKKRKYCQEP